MTEKFTSEQVLAMADRLAKLEVYGACRDGSAMLRAFATLLPERTAAAGDVLKDQYGESITQKLDKALTEISDAKEDVESGKPASAILSFLRLATEYVRDAKDDIAALQAAQPVASVVEGWKLVPEMATKSMILAMHASYFGGDNWQAVWIDALAAAPTTPTEGGENG